MKKTPPKTPMPTGKPGGKKCRAKDVVGACLCIATLACLSGCGYTGAGAYVQTPTTAPALISASNPEPVMAPLPMSRKVVTRVQLEK